MNLVVQGDYWGEGKTKSGECESFLVFGSRPEVEGGVDGNSRKRKGKGKAMEHSLRGKKKKKFLAEGKRLKL